MSKRKEGPFLKNKVHANRNFSLHSPWAGALLVLLIVTQVPQAIKSIIEIIDLSNLNKANRTDQQNHYLFVKCLFLSLTCYILILILFIFIKYRKNELIINDEIINLFSHKERKD